MKTLFTKNPIVRHSFELAIMIDQYSSQLNEIRKYDLARQLFRSGTSICANIMESQNAESKPDFIHKLKIASKEVNETYFWLHLCSNQPLVYPDCSRILIKLDETTRVLNSIIATTKNKMK